MGIYDREYYRGETRGSAWFSGTTPVCNALIVINVAIFLLQNLAKLPDEVIGVNFAASVEETFHHYKLWQLVTAAFFHDGLMHLFFNMWFFWIVAREMEPLYGSRDFLAFYLGAAVFSTLIWLLFAVVAGQACRDDRRLGRGHGGCHPLHVVLPQARDDLHRVPDAHVGPSVAHPGPRPDSGLERPGNEGRRRSPPGRRRLCVALQAVRSQVVAAGQRTALAAPPARFQSGPAQTTSRSRSSSPSRTTANVGGTPRAPSVSVLPEEQLDARLDEVLAKIAREGRSGLTEEELRVLQEASRRARIKRSDRP